MKQRVRTGSHINVEVSHNNEVSKLGHVYIFEICKEIIWHCSQGAWGGGKTQKQILVEIMH